MSKSRSDSLNILTATLRAFSREREWEHFHSPKNLAMAMSVEVAEVLEHFQWITEAASLDLAPEKREEVGAELADVLIYLVRLSDRLGIDALSLATKKVAAHAELYPVALARGSARKYTSH